jgi:hypothetical protein
MITEGQEHIVQEAAPETEEVDMRIDATAPPLVSKKRRWGLPPLCGTCGATEETSGVVWYTKQQCTGCYNRSRRLDPERDLRGKCGPPTHKMQPRVKEVRTCTGCAASSEDTKFGSKELCKKCYEAEYRARPKQQKPTRTCSECAVTSDEKMFPVNTMCVKCYEKNRQGSDARRQSARKCARARYVDAETRRELGIHQLYVSLARKREMGININH